jgi:nicotinamide-nucleotide amidase
LYLHKDINPNIRSPHLFLLPGPPRELQPIFRESVLSILRSIVPVSSKSNRRLYKFAMTGESIIEEAIGEELLAIPGIELGYCARPAEVDLRIIGEATSIDRADAIIRSKLGSSIFSTNDESLEEVIVKLLTERKGTVATAESCTGGLLAHRLTNVAGASAVFLATYVTYSNEAKIDALGLVPEQIKQHGAVSEPVARAMAEGARARARSTYAIATTGIAGPTGGSSEKPAGTVYVALASADQETIARKFFFPSDRETFKQMTAQAAFELLRKKLVAKV